ncbi:MULTISPECIES: ABC transporter permease [Bacillus]|uniref:Peptide ABC transporter permease n=2 Tax=Bacillus TaxID=1386 RepID=A0A0M4FJ60_9BACI|nr:MULTISPECIES: ABC transporter permease [Bacillus]ALC83074.1 peptide ABC transporter permease [Bacillus gobiensis]MBP1082118.1 peptide/nickel transport system permease protein [Bacillus capparidis]MED1096741.1 ABC transporter permease [Bacillus capparidis]
MQRLLVNRGITACIVLLGSLFLVFSINYFLPSDVVDQLLAENGSNPEIAENLRKELGLDLPFHVQFFNYITNLFQGDFGQSIINGEPVIEKIFAQLPATIMLTIASAAIAIFIGVTLGVLAAIHHNSLIDYMARIVGLVGISMPTFWSGILLILIFSIQLGWFPAMGSNGFSTLVMPAVTLGLVGAGFIVRIVRNSMLEVINESFILTLRSKGISERLVMYRHALRNALIPAITMIGIIIGDFLGGAVVIETVFARQGIGRIVADAIMAKDLPVVQGVVFFSAIIYVSINLLVDISYSLIDPRIRRSQLGGFSK